MKVCSVQRIIRPAARRSSRGLLQSEEARTCRSFWEELDAPARSSALRFTDARLVERIIQAQQELLRADLRCYVFGIRGQDAVSERSEMGHFAIESAEGASDGSEVFFAKAEFAERADLFDYLEKQLRTPFLKGRQQLRRCDWHMLFEALPKSWPEFLRRVLALVELAILDARCVTAPAGPSITAHDHSSSASKAEEELLRLEAEDQIQKASKSAKRKARKRRQAAREAEEQEETGVQGSSSWEAESAAGASSSAMGESHSVTSASTRLHLPHSIACADDDTVSISTMDTAVLRPISLEIDEVLQVDWSMTAPTDTAERLETVEESSINVELEVDWSTASAAQTEEARWSAGLTDSLTGVSAEWHWVSVPAPMLTCGNVRAHVKNTFWQVYDEDDPASPPDELRRARSAPALRGRRAI